MLHKTKIVGLTLLISALCMQSAYSYSNFLINDTNGEIEFIVKYLGESVLSCRPDSVKVGPRQSVNVPASACCLKFIDCAKKIGGKVVTTRYLPKTQCASHLIKVTDRKDGTGIDVRPLNPAD